MGGRLEGWQAPLTAAFVREAKSVYAERGLLAALSPRNGRPRFVGREQRELRREVLIEPLAELGLVAMNGPNDPEPSLVIEDGRVVELDGRREQDWDALDHFVARYGLDLDVAAEAAELEDVEIARRLVDVDAARSELVRLSRGLTPARLARVIAMLDPVELMFALKKLRAPGAGQPGARDEPEGEPRAARRRRRGGGRARVRRDRDDGRASRATRR